LSLAGTIRHLVAAGSQRAIVAKGFERGKKKTRNSALSSLSEDIIDRGRGGSLFESVLA